MPNKVKYWMHFGPLAYKDTTEDTLFLAKFAKPITNWKVQGISSILLL